MKKVVIPLCQRHLFGVPISKSYFFLIDRGTVLVPVKAGKSSEALSVLVFLSAM